MQIITNNKKALFNFEILEKFEAGIVLKGCEIKSIRQNKINFSESSFIFFKQGELWVKNINISIYSFTSYKIDPLRERKLLLKKKEIKKISKKINETGISCVVLNVFISKKGLAKLTIALAKGKKKHDKRETKKKKEVEKKIKQAIKKIY